MTKQMMSNATKNTPYHFWIKLNDYTDPPICMSNDLKKTSYVPSRSWMPSGNRSASECDDRTTGRKRKMNQAKSVIEHDSHIFFQPFVNYVITNLRLDFDEWSADLFEFCITWILPERQNCRSVATENASIQIISKPCSSPSATNAITSCSE